MGKRRTKAEMEAIRQAIEAAVEKDRPMTVRQVFYRLTVEGVVPKQESRGYNTVQRLLAQMRKSGRIPFEWIVDSSRTVRQPQTFGSAEDALRRMARHYRRTLWAETDVHVQLWLEKEALAGVLWETANEWDVPLWCNRGYASLSYLYSGADEINRAVDAGNHVHVYNFGDRDPSGVNAWTKMREQLLTWIDAPEAVTFERIAVTPEQIERWNLPTRPTKTTDTRSKDFEGRSTELDAIPPSALRELVDDCITRHISRWEMKRIKKIEEEERKTLHHVADNLGA